MGGPHTRIRESFGPTRGGICKNGSSEADPPVSSMTSLEIVMAVVFLLGLLLPVTFGTRVSAPRSALDILSGFSKFNLSLSKLFLSPVVGISLVMVVYSDANLPRVSGLVVLVVEAFLVAVAFKVGWNRKGQPVFASRSQIPDDGLDYARRFRRLEDQIESEDQVESTSAPRHRIDHPG